MDVFDDAETVIDVPAGPDDKRVRVRIKTHGLELQLFFDDFGRQGPLRELRLVPDRDDLDPKALGRLVPQAPLFLMYARAAMSANEENWVGAIEGLRTIGRPGRGLPPEHYKMVATAYAAIVAEGHPHPVKALAEMNHVTISAASRWLTEARKRGLLPR